MTHPMPVIDPMFLVTDTSYGDVSDIVPTTAEDLYPDVWPGYVGLEGQNSFVNAYHPDDFGVSNSTDNQGGFIDRTTYGEMGEVNRNAYSVYGPVEPNLVEDFQLYGDVDRYVRPLESGVGPVGAYDHAGYTAMQVMQQMSPESYTEASLMSLLTEGI